MQIWHKNMLRPWTRMGHLALCVKDTWRELFYFKSLSESPVESLCLLFHFRASSGPRYLMISHYSEITSLFLFEIPQSSLAAIN